MGSIVEAGEGSGAGAEIHPPAPRGVLRGVASLPNSLLLGTASRCGTGCGATDWTEVYGDLVAEVGSGE